MTLNIEAKIPTLPVLALQSELKSAFEKLDSSRVIIISAAADTGKTLGLPAMVSDLNPGSKILVLKTEPKGAKAAAADLTAAVGESVKSQSFIYTPRTVADPLQDIPADAGIVYATYKGAAISHLIDLFDIVMFDDVEAADPDIVLCRIMAKFSLLSKKIKCVVEMQASEFSKRIKSYWKQFGEFHVVETGFVRNPIISSVAITYTDMQGERFMMKRLLSQGHTEILYLVDSPKEGTALLRRIEQIDHLKDLKTKIRFIPEQALTSRTFMDEKPKDVIRVTVGLGSFVTRFPVNYHPTAIVSKGTQTTMWPTEMIQSTIGDTRPKPEEVPLSRSMMDKQMAHLSGRGADQYLVRCSEDMRYDNRPFSSSGHSDVWPLDTSLLQCAVRGLPTFDLSLGSSNEAAVQKKATLRLWLKGLLSKAGTPLDDALIASKLPVDLNLALSIAYAYRKGYLRKSLLPILIMSLINKPQEVPDLFKEDESNDQGTQRLWLRLFGAAKAETHGLENHSNLSETLSKFGFHKSAFLKVSTQHAILSGLLYPTYGSADASVDARVLGNWQFIQDTWNQTLECLLFGEFFNICLMAKNTEITSNPEVFTAFQKVELGKRVGIPVSIHDRPFLLGGTYGPKTGATLSLGNHVSFTTRESDGPVQFFSENIPVPLDVFLKVADDVGEERISYVGGPINHIYAALKKADAGAVTSEHLVDLWNEAPAPSLTFTKIEDEDDAVSVGSMAKMEDLLEKWGGWNKTAAAR